MKKKPAIISARLLGVACMMLFSSRCMSVEMDSGAAQTYGGATNLPLNPERGWYIARETHEDIGPEMLEFKDRGVTMVLLEADLWQFLTRPLDQNKLNEIDRAFALARQAGLSVMFRAAYDYEGKTNPDPKDIKIVLNHIKQLGPLFYKHEDILFNVQAGFFGPWGEWHSTYYGGGKNAPVRPQYQRQLVNALLEAVPESVSVAVRRPEYIRNIADESVRNTERGNHPPVARSEAFGPSKIARLAFHNDALMSEETDMDTYIDPNYPRDREFEWISRHTRYTPMVAETNQVSPFNDAERAIPFLDLINIQSLNLEYHERVLQKWKRARHGGISAFDYIGMMMGYRFELKKADIGETGDGALRLDLEILNSGFGHLLKEKKFELTLTNGFETYRARIDEDARFWNKNEAVKGEYFFRLPPDIQPGEWEAYLSLSSAFESLAENPAYSVGFVNEGVYDAETGLNRIGVFNIAGGADAAAGAGDEAGGSDFSRITP